MSSTSRKNKQKIPKIFWQICYRNENRQLTTMSGEENSESLATKKLFSLIKEYHAFEAWFKDKDDNIVYISPVLLKVNRK